MARRAASTGETNERRTALVAAWVLLAALALVAALLVVRSRTHQVLEPPAPLPSTPVAEPAPAGPSTLAAPLVIPLERLAGLLEEAVPRSFGSLEERHDVPGEDRVALSFVLERDPLRISMDGAVARVETVVRYGLRAHYDPPILPELSGSCGTEEDDRRRLRVVLAAPLALDSAWTLRSRAELVELAPPADTERDRCQVTFLGIDVTDRVVDLARTFLEEQEATIDSIAASLDLRPSFEAWWATLAEPVPLGDSIWLELTPREVRQGRLAGDGEEIRVDLALTAHPRIVVGRRPDGTPPPLPPLGRGDVPTGLDLVVDTRAEYDAASAMLMERLAGTVVEHEGRTVRVDSLRVFGVGDGRLGLDVRVSAERVDAQLYLTGTPRLDPSTGLVSVPDLDLDVATRDLLLATASWLQRHELTRTLRERATWPAPPATEWLAGWLARGINRIISDDLRVRGSVAWVRPRAVYATPEHLVVRIEARARAEVYVRPRASRLSGRDDRGDDAGGAVHAAHEDLPDIRGLRGSRMQADGGG